MLNRVNRVLISNVFAANTGTSLQTIAANDIMVFDRSMRPIVAGETVISNPNNDVIYIAQGLGNGKAIMSFPIQVRNSTKITVAPYAPTVQKVMSIGFNGTTGVFPAVLNNTEYNLNIVSLDNVKVLQNRQNRINLNYVSSSAATDTEVVFKFLAQAGKYNSFVWVEAKTTQASVANVVPLTAIQGVSTLVYSAPHGITSATKFLRIGTTGIATTESVYEIKSIPNATTIELKEPYAGVTSSTLLSGTIAAILVATEVGLVFTAKIIPLNAVDLYDTINFDIGFNEVYGDAFPVSVDVAWAYGSGTYPQIRDMEFFAQGYLGVRNRTLFPGNLLNPPLHASPTCIYRTVTIESFDEHHDITWQGQYKAPLSTVIPFAIDPLLLPVQDTAKLTAFLAIIEPLFESVETFVQLP